MSLDPPLVSFCPARTSSSWPVIRTSGQIGVNILADDQRDLCAQFATSGGDKFAGLVWEHGRTGAPLLQRVLALIEAEIAAEHDAGDHTIVIARVTTLRAHQERRPLLFYRGDYGVLA